MGEKVCVKNIHTEVPLKYVCEIVFISRWVVSLEYCAKMLEVVEGFASLAMWRILLLFKTHVFFMCVWL